MNNLDIFIIFGFLGIFAEVVFTAIIDSIIKKDPILKGCSYLWMFPIYGAAGLLIKFLFFVFAENNWFFRGAIYAAYIIAGEFATGSFLQFYIGRCPWHYTARFSFRNVIRLDYFPIWFIVGLLIEKLLLAVG